MRTVPLRWRILGLVLPLALMPLGIVGGVGYWYVEARLKQDIDERESRAIAEIGSSVRDLLAEVRDTTSFLATHPAVRRYLADDGVDAASAAEVRRTFDEIASLREWVQRVAVIDRWGQERVAVGDALNLRRVVTDRFFFETVARTACQEPVVPSPAGWSTRFSHAVLQAGRLTGVVTVEMKMRPAASFLQRATAQRGGAIALFDDRGTMFAATPGAAAVATVPALRTIAERALAAGGSVSTRTDGQALLMFAAPVDEFIRYLEPTPGEHWFLLTVVSESEAIQRLAALRRSMLLVALASVGLGIAGAAAVARSITRPVVTLLDATDRVGRGDFDLRVPRTRGDEIGELTSRFNLMVASLAAYRENLVRAEAFAAIGRLASAVTHEVRNPLHAIRGCAEYLRLKRGEDPLVARHAEIIGAEVDSLNEFVGNFLRLSRLTQAQRQLVDLADLLRARVALHAHDAEDRHIVVTLELDADLPRVAADAAQVGTVFENLMNNAFEAMPHGGALRIAASRQPDAITVSFSDTGDGMAPEVAAQVFTPFFSTKATGSGLGLATCRRILELHDGTIEFTTRQGAGTCFRLVLPITEEARA